MHQCSLKNRHCTYFLSTSAVRDLSVFPVGGPRLEDTNDNRCQQVVTSLSSDGHIQMNLKMAMLTSVDLKVMSPCTILE